MESQVKSEKNELNEEFRQACDNLPHGLYITVRNELYEKLHWKTSTFYSRYNGRRPVRLIEVEPIQRVFAKYGVEIFNN